MQLHLWIPLFSFYNRSAFSLLVFLMERKNVGRKRMTECHCLHGLIPPDVKALPSLPQGFHIWLMTAVSFLFSVRGQSAAFLSLPYLLWYALCTILGSVQFLLNANVKWSELSGFSWGGGEGKRKNERKEEGERRERRWKGEERDRAALLSSAKGKAAAHQCVPEPCRHRRTQEKGVSVDGNVGLLCPPFSLRPGDTRRLKV